jgi:AraC-like DNA-binding protein
MPAMTRALKAMTRGVAERAKTAQGSVAASLAQGLLEVAASRGASADELLSRAGMGRDDIRDRDARLPLTKYVELIRAAKELTGDAAFALHFGEEVDLAEMSIAHLAAGVAGSLVDAVDRLNRFAPLAIEIGGADERRFRLESEAGNVWLVDSRPDDWPEITESTFARMAAIARRAFRGGEFIRAVHVTHERPVHHAEYARLFRVPVVFRSDRNALLLSGEALPETVAPMPQYVGEILTGHAEAALERLEKERSTRGRVEALVAASLSTGGMTMTSVAKRLGLSRSTLARRLKSEGVTFDDLVDRLRRDLASHLVHEKKLSISEAAFRVGFSDGASLSRAFKRWGGSGRDG